MCGFCLSRLIVSAAGRIVLLLALRSSYKYRWPLWTASCSDSESFIRLFLCVLNVHISQIPVQLLIVQFKGYFANKYLTT